MEKYLNSKIQNKKIGILGFGREGKSTLNTLLKLGGYASLTVIDKRDVRNEVPNSVSCIFGEAYLEDLDEFDLIFKTPGVVLPKDVNDYRCEFTSETEVFMECFRKQIVGITGTKGKSTTSSLLFHTLKLAKKDVLFAGNIGIPVFEIADQVKSDTIIVLELSCHQLEYIKVSPHIAILLNIYEDHLDHYGTREKYGLAKKNIYKFQSSEDVLFTTRETINEWGLPDSKLICVDECSPVIDAFLEDMGAKLRGRHNILNATFVFEAAKLFDVERDKCVEAINTFEPLPHRLQFIGRFNGVDYYDDSISTTVKSAISAVESISNAKVLLIGGMERNIEYTELAKYLSTSRLNYLICMYESGKRFFELYKEYGEKESAPKALLVNDLTEAVKKAKEVAGENEAVLLSPAAASYGYFKNFEERGDVYCALVKKSK